MIDRSSSSAVMYVLLKLILDDSHTVEPLVCRDVHFLPKRPMVSDITKKGGRFDQRSSRVGHKN